MIFCAHLYMKARDMFEVESFSDLCYMCFGRKSVYLINIMVAFIIFGIMILYLILFSKICISLFADTKTPIDQQSFFMKILSYKTTYVLTVAIISIPIMLKRSITQLKG